MVFSLTDHPKSLYVSSNNNTPKQSVINGVKQEDLDKLPEKDRNYILNNIETTNQLLQHFSWYSVSEWDFDLRDNIYRNLPHIKELARKDIHFDSITRVMIYGKVPFEKMQALEPAELKKMICRPGPEPILFLLEKNVSWDALMNLDLEIREDIMSFHRPFLELLNLVSWDQIIALPRDLFKIIIQQPQIIKIWMESGAEWKDIAATPVEVLQSLCVRHYRMTNLLESVSWKEIISLEPNLRALALQKAPIIFAWKTEEKISWQDCLERLKKQ